jgi:hypothetical protein
LSYLALLIILLNSQYLQSPIIGLFGLGFFVLELGLWIGRLYSAHKGIVSFFMGCFIMLAATVLFMGIATYLMVFSAYVLWLFFALVPLTCYIINIRSPPKEIEEIGHVSSCFRFNRLVLAKLLGFCSVVVISFVIVSLGQTGNAISHIGEVVSYCFWPVMGSCFILLYLIWKEKCFSIDVKLICAVLLAILIFGAPLIVYKNYITEDSFALLGDVKSVIQTGIYGWSPHLGRTGYFAIFSSFSISSSTVSYVGDTYKIVTTLLVSIFTFLFIYLILKQITKKDCIFSAFISIFLFPTVLLVSIPIEKSIATLFLLGSIYFSIKLLDNFRKADLYALSLTLIAIPFLHDYFGLFAAVPVLLALTLRIINQHKPNKRWYLVFALIILSLGILIPFSFVIGSYVSNSNPQITFSSPEIESITSFLLPKPKITLNESLSSLVYTYWDNFMWVRYIFLISGIYVLQHSAFLRKRTTEKTLLIATIIVFWIGYFLLKTFVQNPPEEARDYRFGFFLDLALIPIVGIMVTDAFTRLSNRRLRLKAPGIKPRCSSRLLTSIFAIFLIIVIMSSLYCGYNFDRIMERPAAAQGIGRYVVTDCNIQVMQYIQNMSIDKKCVVLSDNHLGKVAQGVLDMDFEKADLFNINSGGALYPYFREMRYNPSRTLMSELMSKTNAQIGFFVIGLDDWRGWQPEGSYWIDLTTIESLKTISDQWTVFHDINDTYVFTFY